MVTHVSRDAATAEFFDGTARKEFLIRRCRQCSAASEPQTMQCEHCASIDLAWEPASGRAQVVSWSVVYGKPSLAGELSTTVIAVAELDEGPWWWSQVIDADPETIMVGQRLRIVFDRADHEDSETVPVFRLD